MLVSEWVVIWGYMVGYGWVGLCPLMEHPLCKRRHEKCFFAQIHVFQSFLCSIGNDEVESVINGKLSTINLYHRSRTFPENLTATFFLLKIGLKPQKGKDRPSNHPFSGAFAVSFREGMIRNGSPWGAQLRGHRFPMVHNVMVPVEMWRFFVGSQSPFKGLLKEGVKQLGYHPDVVWLLIFGYKSDSQLACQKSQTNDPPSQNDASLTFTTATQDIGSTASKCAVFGARPSPFPWEAVRHQSCLWLLVESEVELHGTCFDSWQGF